MKLEAALLAALAVPAVAPGGVNQPSAPGNPGTKPNVVIVLADGLGVECLSSYGGTSHHTPNLDRLAARA